MFMEKLETRELHLGVCFALPSTINMGALSLSLERRDYTSREKVIIITRPDRQPIHTVRPNTAKRTGRYSGGSQSTFCLLQVIQQLSGLKP